MYPTGQNNIGTLLRMIQEDQNNLAAINPSAQPGSPIRGVVQGPLQAPESPGTSRVVSIRPEGTPSVQGTTTPEVVSPVAPAAPVGTPASPVAPIAPINTVREGPNIPTGTLLNNQPNTSVPSGVTSRATSINAPPIAPQIRATPSFNLAPAFSPSSASFTPTRSRVGTQIAQLPTFIGANKGQNAFDKFMDTLFKKTNTSNLAAKIAPKWFG